MFIILYIILYYNYVSAPNALTTAAAQEGPIHSVWLLPSGLYATLLGEN
jgi:hypothetical protein